MEAIGKTLQVKQRREVEVVDAATQFSVLDFRVKPPSHEVEVEVCLMDAYGNAVGGARWVRLNPLIDTEGNEVDTWAQIVKISLVDINSKVKAALQDMEF